MKVTIEMDLNLTQYYRSRYTALDLLAAFGGFMGIFRWIFGQFMAAWNFRALDNYMISKLYRAAAPEDAEKAGGADKVFTRSRLPHCRAYLASYVPSCLAFCRSGMSRKERLRAKANSRLKKETDIVQMVKSIRFLTRAVNQLLSSSQRHKIKDQTSLLTMGDTSFEEQTQAD